MNIKAILSLASVGLLLYTVYEQNEAINRLKDDKVVLIKHLQKMHSVSYDSLQTELFKAQSMNGRYELGLEHLKEVNPSSFYIIEAFIEHETE
jgi:hypothetical protein